MKFHAQFAEASVLHYALLVPQRAAVTSGNDARILKSFVFPAARLGELICTCIFPCLLCVNQHATAQPHSRHCQAEQAIIWAAAPPPHPPPNHELTPLQSLSLFLIYNQVMKHSHTHTNKAAICMLHTPVPMTQAGLLEPFLLFRLPSFSASL